jgi:nucleoside-diphosphate-sugar epimerase
MTTARHVFVTGGTGYMGRRLIPLLLDRGHTVTAVAREGSERKLPRRCEAIVADVLDRTTWEHHLRPFHTLVHLVGVAHPSPSKALEFVDIDLRSAREAIEASRKARVEHFVYVSVAHPAPAMKSYVMVRTACEDAIREAGLHATVLRPWYVLGPGHWWPLALLPFYKVAEIVPWTSNGAKRLGLVKLDEMIAALAHAVENPADDTKIVEVPAIREIAKTFV